jgi:hypothetical protein
MGKVVNIARVILSEAKNPISGAVRLKSDFAQALATLCPLCSLC